MAKEILILCACKLLADVPYLAGNFSGGNIFVVYAVVSHFISHNYNE